MVEEITKHTKKIYKEVRNTKHSFGEKVKDVIVEICIIVFAVTISIWLHGWSEHRHQQREVREFLTDIRNDLKDDVANLKNARDTMKKNRIDFLFLRNLTKQKYDSIHKIHADVRMNARLATIVINSGNYEGFKSSGKIGYIENKKLKNSILNYYEKVTPLVAETDKANMAQALKIISFLMETDEDEDLSKILLGSKVKAMTALHTDLQLKFSIETFDAAIYYANDIIREIDKQATN
ncbi:MAG: hypothetical protein JNK00_00050 [Flavipsychrobacter sp.]|nr:hypothetical protein [Flavipsychrobacter sp.]